MTQAEQKVLKAAMQRHKTYRTVYASQRGMSRAINAELALYDACAALSRDQKFCSQCGRSIRARACGPTHAILAARSRKQKRGD
jgi:hypothetical protein